MADVLRRRLNQHNDLFNVALTEDEAQEIIKFLPERDLVSASVKAKLKTLLAKKEHRDTHPHKLADDYDTMKSCPYRGDWHYCCRCKFDYIGTGSDNYDKNMVKKYIEENWGK